MCINDTPKVVHGKFSSSFPDELYPWHNKDRQGRSSTTSLTYRGALQRTVDTAKNTSNLCYFKKWKFVCSAFCSAYVPPAFPLEIPSVLSVFRFSWLSSVGRVPGLGCAGVLSDCSATRESTSEFEFDYSTVPKHGKTQKIKMWRYGNSYLSVNKRPSIFFEKRLVLQNGTFQELIRGPGQELRGPADPLKKTVVLQGRLLTLQIHRFSFICELPKKCRNPYFCSVLKFF